MVFFLLFEKKKDIFENLHLLCFKEKKKKRSFEQLECKRTMTRTSILGQTIPFNESSRYYFSEDIKTEPAVRPELSGGHVCCCITRSASV